MTANATGLEHPLATVDGDHLVALRPTQKQAVAFMHALREALSEVGTADEWTLFTLGSSDSTTTGVWMRWRYAGDDEDDLGSTRRAERAVPARPRSRLPEGFSTT